MGLGRSAASTGPQTPRASLHGPAPCRARLSRQLEAPRARATGRLAVPSPPDLALRSLARGRACVAPISRPNVASRRAPARRRDDPPGQKPGARGQGRGRGRAARGRPAARRPPAARRAAGGRAGRAPEVGAGATLAPGHAAAAWALRAPMPGQQRWPEPADGQGEGSTTCPACASGNSGQDRREVRQPGSPMP